MGILKILMCEATLKKLLLPSLLAGLLAFAGPTACRRPSEVPAGPLKIFYTGDTGGALDPCG